MKSLLLDGESKAELSIGLVVTVGEHIGEKVASSESKCTEIIWPSKSNALGVLLKRILTM